MTLTYKTFRSIGIGMLPLGIFCLLTAGFATTEVPHYGFLFRGMALSLVLVGAVMFFAGRHQYSENHETRTGLAFAATGFCVGLGLRGLTQSHIATTEISQTNELIFLGAIFMTLGLFLSFLSDPPSETVFTG